MHPGPETLLLAEMRVRMYGPPERQANTLILHPERVKCSLYFAPPLCRAFPHSQGSGSAENHIDNRFDRHSEALLHAICPSNG